MTPAPGAAAATAELPLRDIHLPDPIGWWPPAPGWWLLAVTLLLLGAVGVRVWHRRRQARAPLRQALRELRALETTAAPGPETLQALAALMKRVALSLAARETVAGLSGRDWLDWLAERTGDERFRQEPGQALAVAPYRPRVEPEEARALLALCRAALERLAARPRPGKQRR